MITAFKIHNSLAREKQVFEPVNPEHVRLYACGPTVYNYAHIGNARMAVVFDLLTNVLRRIYPKVTYVSNITDVDDKIMAAAEASGEEISAITEKYTRIYNDDMAALGVKPPDIQPKATEHIGDMINHISDLIAKDHAYEKDGHVLFHVPSFPEYGGLSGRSRDEQIAGARVEVAPYKKDAADFVLWKPSADNQPGWDSPWGYGRPGWHIECSAMSEAHLGLPFDIHGGGADLKFPHHENEIAQSCCSSGCTDDLTSYCKYWAHNGFVTVEGEKMSKSLGNVTLVHDLLESGTHKGAAIRIALLSAQYRQPLDWGEQAYHQAQALYDRIAGALERLEGVEAADSTEADEGVMAALLDDLNTPLAFAKLGELIKNINKSEPSGALKARLLATIDVLGIDMSEAAQDAGDVDVAAIEALLEERTQARADKNFTRSDEIRDELAAQGIQIIDTPSGAKWKKG